jgi:hypothetical protein
VDARSLFLWFFFFLSRVFLGFLPRYAYSPSLLGNHAPTSDAFGTQDPLPTGRSAGSAWWAGLTNLYYTCVVFPSQPAQKMFVAEPITLKTHSCDPVKGVANIIATQQLPFNDPAVLGPWLEAEKAVYDSL